MPKKTYKEILENLHKLNKISSSSSLHEFILAFSLKYDTHFCIENYNLPHVDPLAVSFRNSVHNLHKNVNCSKIVRQNLCYSYASSGNANNKNFSVLSFSGNPRTDKGEVFIRAFTPNLLYKRFDDLIAFSGSHMLAVPSGLAVKVVNNQIDCLAFNSNKPFYFFENPSKSVLESVSLLWEPYDTSSVYHRFDTTYKAAIKIENPS